MSGLPYITALLQDPADVPEELTEPPTEPDWIEEKIAAAGRGEGEDTARASAPKSHLKPGPSIETD